jgi:hypothetical protein
MAIKTSILIDKLKEAFKDLGYSHREVWRDSTSYSIYIVQWPGFNDLVFTRQELYRNKSDLKPLVAAKIDQAQGDR